MPAPESEMTADGAYYELEGALIDLKREGADPICIKTIERVQKWIDPALAAAHAQGKAEENEACARIVDDTKIWRADDRCWTLGKIAEAIRSRLKPSSEQKE